MATINYGGSAAYRNGLYFISTDLVLDINNQNTGIDLLRRIFGSFCYYATSEDGHKLISMNEYETANFENLIGTYIQRVTPLDCEQIQYAEVNPARIQIIDKNVDIPNFKIPIRLFADKDNNSVKGDYHWKQFLFGGEYAGQQLPKRLDSEKIYYDATFYFQTPIDYKTQQNYASADPTIVPTEPPSYVPKCNIFSNYYDYNDNVQKYQDWSSELESELLMPNFYVVSEQYRTVRNKLYAEAGVPGFGVDTDEEEAIKDQLSYMDNMNKVMQYHFPAGAYWTDLAQDEYFGSYFTGTGKNIQFKQAALNSMQNIIFDQHYFNYAKDEIHPSHVSADTPFVEYGLDAKLSTFFNVQIKFERHQNTVFFPDIDGVITADGLGDRPDVANLKHSAPDYSKQRFRKLIEEADFSSRMLEILKDVDNGDITEIPKKRLPFNYSMTKDLFTFDRLDADSPEAPFLTERPETPVGLDSINFMDFLSYTYNNYNVALNDNYIFAGLQNQAKRPPCQTIHFTEH